MRQSRLESGKKRGPWILAWALGGLVVVVLVIVVLMERPSQPAPMVHPFLHNPAAARTATLPGGLSLTERNSLQPAGPDQMPGGSPTARNSLPPPVPGHYTNITGHPGPK